MQHVGTTGTRTAAERVSDRTVETSSTPDTISSGVLATYTHGVSLGSLGWARTLRTRTVGDALVVQHRETAVVDKLGQREVALEQERLRVHQVAHQRLRHWHAG